MDQNELFYKVLESEFNICFYTRYCLIKKNSMATKFKGVNLK